ncbi:dihydroorotase [Psychroflexus maritimus]|uniref:Dihydroorotase n=1 Tax=Psychroflexus maritimus TaxID=2714865 RepID=A0A967AEC8_9FLAO|nr:dihydroorotase [Psychroflexus maritimus]NGZ88951.1 dihydroorotase [Psychroflexus maritimus]
MNNENKILIKNTTIINEGKLVVADVLIANEIILQIGNIDNESNYKLIDGTGKHLFPGIIDGQVHFRDPGLTHKGDLYTESKAAIAGGVTSFIDMPNTIPTILNVESLNQKYKIASQKSLANYSFFLGVNGENIDDVIKMDTRQFIGVSDDGLYFSKKGNLLADSPEKMEKLFANCQSIIAIHSEKEEVIEANEKAYKKKYGEAIPAKFHPLIRSAEGCYEASKRAIEIAKKHKARFHVLHLTTEAETHLFQNDIPLQEKKITTEVSVHHLWFSDKDYDQLGMLIKWNPAIKTEKDRKGLFKALLDDRIDLITTDHAPHTLEEKQQTYFKSMSGAPMVQHSLNCMLEFYKQGLISLEKIVEKMCHNPAILYNMTKRGFIKEGYYADLTLVDLHSPWTVNKENLLYKCGWSPLEGTSFQTEVKQTFVNGNLVYDNGKFNENKLGKPIEFTNN